MGLLLLGLDKIKHLWCFRELRMMRKPVITIDGPSGAGKSTISKLLAERLSYTYIDTGALYRVVALKVQQSGSDLDNSEQLRLLCSRLDVANILIPDLNTFMVCLIYLNGSVV